VAAVAIVVSASLCAVSGCETPTTTVILDNDYSAASNLVVYRAFYQSVSFQEPIPPGSSSQPQNPPIPASANTAYVILAPGWDPDSSAAPTSFVLLQSRQGYAVHLNDTLHIVVNDANFVGNCAAGMPLTQNEADVIVNFVFTPTIFPDAAAPFRYDAATCQTIPTP
jgi:hypothetical protein